MGLIGVAVAYQLFGRPGLSSGAKQPSQSLAVPDRPDHRIQVAPQGVRRISTGPSSAMAMQRLDALPTRSRIEVVNHLEPDEEPEFVLLGANQDAVIGTDRRVIVIPEGRNGFESLWSRTFESLSNAQIEQQRNGARLLIKSERPLATLPIVRLSGDAQIESGIDALRRIRQRIVAAQQTLEEDTAPTAQSAFTETAHKAIPPAGNRASLSLGDMLEMNPTEFEEFTGKALESLGYTNVNRVGGSGDLAADLTATDPQGRSAIVQCKRYTPGSKVGSPALQSFIGMKSIHHKADRGIFVTTADYSQQAIDLAKEHSIVLIDGDDLVKIAALVLTPSSSTVTEQPTTPGHYCHNCGERTREGMKFCANCGANLVA